jgi:transposase
MVQNIVVGLDVHADSITAAILEGDNQNPEVITLPGNLMKVRQLFRRLTQKAPVRACYEASGAGFVLHRVLTNDGFHCDVIAPSLVPRKPGERRKTDRLDAIMLARLYRSGHLTAVHVPNEDQEALRFLLRKAVVAVECENSLWRSKKMPDFGKELSPQRRLGGKPGLKKAAVVPTATRTSMLLVLALRA